MQWGDNTEIVADVETEAFFDSEGPEEWKGRMSQKQSKMQKYANRATLSTSVQPDETKSSSLEMCDAALQLILTKHATDQTVRHRMKRTLLTSLRNRSACYRNEI